MALINREKLLETVNKNPAVDGNARTAQILDAILKAPEEEKWISVKDRLPEKTHDEDGTLANYIIYMPEYGADIGNYLKPANSWVCMGLPVKVTHWRLLPEPPEEGER